MPDQQQKEQKKQIYVINPDSGRYISSKSRIYKRLLKEGRVEAPPEPIVEPEPEPKIEPPKVVLRPAPSMSFEKKMINEATDIVADNVDKFDGLSQKESDALLRELLMRKLKISEPKKTKKKKSKKRIKFKVKTPPPSSSESESVSESESD